MIQYISRWSISRIKGAFSLVILVGRGDLTLKESSTDYLR